VPSCLLRCLFEGRNDRIFEDYEKTLEELKSFFFYSLYIWISAFVALLEINFHDFLIHFSPFS
jgi:hypothetical protein